jgi:actin-related protein
MMWTYDVAQAKPVVWTNAETEVTLHHERFRVGEALFDPPARRAGDQLHDLGSIVYDTLLECQRLDGRNTFKSVVLSGGTSLLPGLSVRLSSMLMNLDYLSERLGFPKFLEPPFRGDLLPWIGGSILASVEGTESAWISKELFDEDGPSVVHRMCF